MADMPVFRPIPTIPKRDTQADNAPAGARLVVDARAESFMPQILWRTVHQGVEGGWNVYVIRRPELRQGDGIGWAVILWDAQHCVHLEYIRADDPRFPKLVWRLINRELRTRCPHGDRVNVRDLTHWLRHHAEDCAARLAEQDKQRTPITDMVFMPNACLTLHPQLRPWMLPDSLPRVVEEQ